MFKRKDERGKLVNDIDVMMATLSKHSSFLKVQHDACYKQAERLAKDGIEEASKKWLATAIVCKKMRSNLESQIADLFALRVQITVTPPGEMGPVVARANELLARAERAREATERAMGQLTDIMRLRMEAPTGAEYYGVSPEEVEREFEAMQERMSIEAAEEMGLPEVPKEAATRPEAERAKEEERGKEGG